MRTRRCGLESLESRRLLATISTSFEGISSTNFNLGTGPDVANFSGDAFSGQMGVGELYRTGSFAWMVNQGGTGTIQFNIPAESTTLYARLRSTATTGQLTITARQPDNQVINSVTLTDAAQPFQEINFSGLIGRIEFVNTTDQMVSIDDFLAETVIVNRRPNFTAVNPPTVLEDSGTQTVNGFATFDPGDPSESAQKVLAYNVLDLGNPDLFATPPSIDPSGNLTYTLADDAFGSTTFAVTVQDDGGTTNGGIDTSQPKAFTITVAGVNDAPSFTTGDDITVNEDSGPQTFAGFASEFDPGPLEDGTSLDSRVLHDEGPGGTLNPLSADNNNPTNVGALSHGSNIVRGQIERAKTAGNVDVFTFTVSPGFQLSGLFVLEYEYVTPPTNPNERAAFLAIDDSASFPYNASDLDINDNPFLDETLFLGGTVFGLDDLPAVGGGNILPRAGVITGSGFTGPLPAGTYTIYIQQTGPANTYSLDFNVTSVNKQEVMAYAVANLSNPALFSSPPQVDSSGTLRFTPAADANGVALFELSVQDNGGTENQGIDTSTPQIATISVTSVNDPPSFTATDPPAVIENSGVQTVSSFVNNFDPGPDDESAQTLVAHNVTNVSNPGLFAVAPMIDGNGDLTYTPAADAFGTSTFEVTIQDSGGTENGGVNTSDKQTFTITVTAAPDFDYGDAPAPYPVLLADQGARHVIGSLFLGESVDFETDGQPSDQADQDGSDEDGVLVMADLVSVAGAVTTASAEVIASQAGLLDAWVDFNGDGDWDDANEQIATGVSLDAGSNVVGISIPAGATTGDTAARFRISSGGGLTPKGDADDGEVEDYLFSILDGDAAPTVNVTLIDTAATIGAAASELTLQAGGMDLFRAPLAAVNRFIVTGTDGNDQIVIDLPETAIPTGGFVVDGRAGDNQLRLAGGSSVNLTGGVSVRDFTTIDLTDAAPNQITLNVAAVQTASPATHAVTVIGGTDDMVAFQDADEWRMGQTSIVEGRFIRSVVRAPNVGGDETLQVDLPRPWQNIVQASDVNNNGVVTALDALVVVGEFTRRAYSDPDTQQLDDPLSVADWPGTYFDQSGDGLVTPLDALRIINELARAGEGEQESLVVARDQALQQLADEEHWAEDSVMDLVQQKSLRCSFDFEIDGSQDSSQMKLAAESSGEEEMPDRSSRSTLAAAKTLASLVARNPLAD